MKHEKLVTATCQIVLFLALCSVVPAIAQTTNKSQPPHQSAAEIVFNKARELALQGTTESLQASISKFEEAQKLYIGLGNKQFEANCFGWLGYVHNLLGNKQKAIEYYNQTLPLFRAIADKNGEAVALHNAATIYADLGEKQKALEYFNQALLLKRAVGDKSGEAVALGSIGTAYDALGNKQKALEYYHQALSLRKIAGDKNGEATTLNNIGLVYAELGEKQKALEYFNQALSLRRAVANKGGEAETLNNIGVIYSDLGEKQKALEFYNEALLLRRIIGDKKGEAVTLGSIGLVYSDLGEKRKALEFYNQSLSLRKAAGDKSGEAGIFSKIASIYDGFGDRQKALEHYNQALPLYKSIGDKSAEAATLNSIGVDYFFLGENQKALEYFNQALSLRRTLGNKAGEAQTLNNIGEIYSNLGENQKAQEYLSQSLPLYKIVDDKSGEAMALNSTGKVYSILGDKQKALEYFSLALPLMKAAGNKWGEAITLNNIATAYNDLDNKQKALEFHNQALPLRKATGDKRGEAITLSNIGKVYDDLGNKQKALEFYNQALPIFRAAGEKSGEAVALNNIMYVWKSLNILRLASIYGKQSVNLRQKLREVNQGLDKEIQKSHLKSIEFTFRELAEILLLQDRLAEAQQVLNAFKDQQFFDFDQTQIKAVPLALTPREAGFVARYEKTSERVGAISGMLEDLKRKIGSRQPTPEENEQIKQLEADLKTATDEFTAVLKQAETEFSAPPDEKDKVGEIPDTVEMQTALRQLNEQTGQRAVAVYQLVGEKTFSVLLITPNSSEKIISPVKGKQLNEKAKKLWALLQSDKYDATRLSKQIYDAVFKPLEEKLPRDTTTIMWSLDDNLRYLPMAALYDGNKFLVERFSHVVFTRADKERMTRKVSPAWTGLGFGSSQAATVEVLGERISFSPLPGVREELGAIFKSEKGGILDGVILPDAKFTKQSFLDSLRRRSHPLVHIASHFSFRPDDEARSFLLLGDGGVLTLEEMKRERSLFQGVELLTLSACNTAGHQTGNGREIDNFAELAQRLGAGAVMATIWSVADNSTPRLMREFYSVRQSRMTKTEALRKAQLALLIGTAETKALLPNEKGTAQSKVQIVIVPQGVKRNNNQSRSDEVFLEEAEAPPFKKDTKKPFAHPYFWSPFVLIGNWR